MNWKSLRRNPPKVGTNITIKDDSKHFYSVVYQGQDLGDVLYINLDEIV